MKYPTVNKNKPANFLKIKSPDNLGARRQEPGRTFQPRNPAQGKDHNISGKSFEEYLALAQASMGQGDRLLAEAYYQYAEHALRVRNKTEENPSITRAHARSLASQDTAARLKDFEALLENELSNV